MTGDTLKETGDGRLRIDNLEVSYGRAVRAVRGVSLSVGAGEFVVVLGSNGAGKTTVLNAVAGVLRYSDGQVDAGRVDLDGRDVTHAAPETMAKAGVTLVPQGRRVFGHLSVDDNLRAGGHLLRRHELQDQLDQIYGWFPRLLEFRRRTAGFLSGGEQQLLAVGRALMSRPKVLMLDEPSLGLAPKIIETVFSTIRSIVDETNVGVLVVEQNAMVALGFGDRGYVLENGSIVLEGTTSELGDNSTVRDFYLGGGAGAEMSFADVKSYRRRKRWSA